MKLHRVSVLLGAAIGALVIGMIGLAGLSARPTEAQDDLRLAIQKSQLMGVAYQLDTSGLHEIDDKLNAGEFVPGVLGKVRKARIAVQASMWPAEMQETANTLSAEMLALETALRDEDVTTGAPHATQVHNVAHTLADAIYTWLSTGQAPIAPANGH